MYRIDDIILVHFKIEEYDIELGASHESPLTGMISCYGSNPFDQCVRIFFKRNIDSIELSSPIIGSTAKFTVPSSDMASFVDMLRNETHVFVELSEKSFKISTAENDLN